MAGKLNISKIQLGNNGTAANNFLISEDGAGGMKIQRGNDGGALTDVLTIDVNGKITSAYDVAAGQLGLTANGYAKLPNGLILQWGTASVTTGTFTNVTFPIAFPNAVLSGTTGTGNGTATAASYSTIGTYTLTTMQIALNTGSGTVKWFVIGY